MAFQEGDVSLIGTSWPQAPLFQKVSGWAKLAFDRSGVDLTVSLRLFQLFQQAGLPAPRMELMTAVGGGADWVGYENLAEITRSLLPVILKFGIATEQEVGIETLAARLREEMLEVGGAVIAAGLMSVWARQKH